jgi:hypothetical protein
MPFLFKPYRLTRSTREVLARLRLKLVLSKQPLLGLGLSGRVVPYWLGGSQHQPRRGTAYDGDLVDF